MKKAHRGHANTVHWL